MSQLAQVHAWTTQGLDQHVGYIKRQVDRSLDDGETRQLAVKIVSGSYDYAVDRRTGKEVPVVKAWGRTFRAPNEVVCRTRDDKCEIERIWDFMVLNCRFVEDPRNVDTFATLRETLFAGGGDCDDATTGFCALLGSVGFSCIARVISTAEDPETWVHIYPLVGLPKNNPNRWLPLDITVKGALPGWQYENIARKRDFQMV